MHTQVLVLPLPPSVPRTLRLLADPLPAPAPVPILDKLHTPAAQSGASPSCPLALHALLDNDPRAGPRDHASLPSPQQYPISTSNVSHVLPSQPRPPCILSSLGTTTKSDPSTHVSPPTSPSQMRQASSFQPPHSAPHHLNQFSSSATSYTPNMDRYSIANLADRYLRGTDKYSHNQYPLLDQRRMSEPAMRGTAASGYPTNTADLFNARYHQFQHRYSYVPPRSYAPHSSSPLHRSADSRPTNGSWKEDHPLALHPYDPIELDEPLSPLNPTFSGGESSPPMGMSPAMFGSLHEDYGPSPPGTGTSASSNPPPIAHPQPHTTAGPSTPPSSRQYSFVSLPGNAVKKRPRRRYDEIERLYQCSWPNCSKAYGTLNHLNAHITMQKHGSKRSPNEFKELRKQWRKAKKEEAEARALGVATRLGSQQQQQQHPLQQHASRHSMSDAEYQAHNVRPPFEYTHHPERSVQPIGPLDDFHDSLVHHEDVYPRRSQRYSPFVSPHPQHSGMQYPHPHAHGATTSNMPTDRLPANSTLLTPLPGYESSSMSGGPGFGGYDSYDIYRNDNRARTALGSPESLGDRGRARSNHANPGAGHDHDCP